MHQKQSTDENFKKMQQRADKVVKFLNRFVENLEAPQAPKGQEIAKAQSITEENELYLRELINKAKKDRLDFYIKQEEFNAKLQQVSYEYNKLSKNKSQLEVNKYHCEAYIEQSKSDPIRKIFNFFAKIIFGIPNLIISSEEINLLRHNKELNRIEEKRIILEKMKFEEQNSEHEEIQKKCYKLGLDKILTKNENHRVEGLKQGLSVDQVLIDSFDEWRCRGIYELNMTYEEVCEMNTDRIKEILSENAGRNLQKANKSDSYISKMPPEILIRLGNYMSGSAKNMQFFEKGFNQETEKNDGQQAVPEATRPNNQ